jgi:hypothetical protein
VPVLHKLEKRIMTPKPFRRLLLLGCLCLWGSCPPTQGATLLGIDSDTGNLYQVSTTNASLTLIGNTGMPMPADLQFAPDGTLYSFTVGTNSTLYRIDPSTAHATSIGLLSLGTNVFEGGLAFSPDGTAYGCNIGTAAAAKLFKLNLITGQATIIGTIPGTSRDIDGLAWRSDGILVGLDRVSNALLAINPQTAAVLSNIVVLSPVVGAVGGLTASGNSGYFSTAGPNGILGMFPGSNELYSFDLFTGVYTKIGSFSPTITGTGIAGIALTPTLTTQPKLSMSLTGNKTAQIAWATNFTGYTLKYATGPYGAAWNSVTNSVVTKGGSFTVQCSCTGTQRVYRLQKP